MTEDDQRVVGHLWPMNGPQRVPLPAIGQPHRSPPGLPRRVPRIQPYEAQQQVAFGVCRVASAHPSSEGTIVGGKRRDVVKLGGQSPDKLTPSSALALSLRKLSGTLLSGQELPAEQLRSVLEGLQKLDAQQSSQEAASAFQWLEPAPEPEPDLGPELPELVKPSASSDNGGGTEGGGAEGGHLTCGQLVHELFGFFLWVPALMFALNMALGCLLAAIEEWELVAGVQYVFSVQVGLASPLGQANTIGPTTNFGMAMTGVIAAWTMGFTGAISTLAATSHLVDALTLPGRWLAAHMQCIGSRDERKAHREAHKLGHVLSKRRRHRKHQRPLLIGKLLNALLLGPLLLLLPCVTLGAVLAALETADCSAPSVSSPTSSNAASSRHLPRLSSTSSPRNTAHSSFFLFLSSSYPLPETRSYRPQLRQSLPVPRPTCFLLMPPEALRFLVPSDGALRSRLTPMAGALGGRGRPRSRRRGGGQPRERDDLAHLAVPCRRSERAQQPERRRDRRAVLVRVAVHRRRLLHARRRRRPTQPARQRGARIVLGADCRVLHLHSHVRARRRRHRARPGARRGPLQVLVQVVQAVVAQAGPRTQAGEPAQVNVTATLERLARVASHWCRGAGRVQTRERRAER